MRETAYQGEGGNVDTTKTQSGFVRALIAAALALAAAVGIMLPAQNAWAEEGGDFTLTVQKHWTDKQGNAIDVPFDKLDVMVHGYRYESVPGSSELVKQELTQPFKVEVTPDGWVSDAVLSNVEDYEQFEVVSEVAYIEGEEVNLAQYGLLEGGWSITFNRDYENATATQSGKEPSCSNVKIPGLDGSGFVLVGLTGNSSTGESGYVLWMPYMENLSQSARDAIRAAIRGNGIDNGIGNVGKKDITFYDELASGAHGIDAFYRTDGKVDITMEGPNEWNQVWWGPFAFMSKTGEPSHYQSC